MCGNLTVCQSRLILTQKEFNLHVFTAPSVLYGFINPLRTYLSKPSSDKDWQGRCDHATSECSSANLIQGCLNPANAADQAKHNIKCNIQWVMGSYSRFARWRCGCFMDLCSFSYSYPVCFSSCWLRYSQRQGGLWSIMYTSCPWPFQLDFNLIEQSISNRSREQKL